MGRVYAAIIAALAVAACPTATFADNEMRQSPLLMRRAGPSCRPGNLGAQPGAGYHYQLGPCAGADASAAPDFTDGQRTYRRRRF